MIRIVVCFIIAVFCGINSVNARIITTDKIEVIEAEFAVADGNTLVVFDCDEVLIYAADNIFLPQNVDVLNKISYEYGKSLGSKEAYFYFRSIVMRDMKALLLNDKWPLLITVLQSRGIKTILLTACDTGKYGVIDSFEQWRRNQLLPFGIDFKKSWPNLRDIRFTEFNGKVKTSNGIPAFSDGMLLTGDIPKGVVLQAFLSKVKDRRFSKIVFLDDKIENLQSVEMISQAMGIEFVGIEYTYSNTLASAIDMQKIRKKFDLLIREKKWFSCAEIEAL